MTLRIPVTGVVVAGGASKRMGRDKAWVELEGKPLVAYVIHALERIAREVIVVTNDARGYEKFDVRVIPDELPGTGSLGGIYSGLNAARDSLAVMVGCDMPFLNSELLSRLVSLTPGYDVVIPSAVNRFRPPHKAKSPESPNRATAKDKNLHPLHAAYARACLGPIRAAIGRDDLRLVSFYESVRVNIVEEAVVDRIDPQHLSFWNLNTPEELARAKTVVELGHTIA